MNPLNEFQCVPCTYFQKGLCLCVRRKDGPRATRDCRTCRCQIVNLILCKKLRTHKIFYHLQNNKQCTCKLLCRLRNNGKQCYKKTKKGKITFTLHKTCEPFYSQCKQMQALEKNFKELSGIVKKNEKLCIPSNCTPFLGTARRNFPELKEYEQECFIRRQNMAAQIKASLNWKKPSQMKQKLAAENVEFQSRIELYTRKENEKSSEKSPKKSVLLPCGGNNETIIDNNAEMNNSTLTRSSYSTNTVLSSAREEVGKEPTSQNVTQIGTQTEEATFASSISTTIQYYGELNRNRSQVRT